MISNGANAVDLLGQYDANLSAPSPDYGKFGRNDGPNSLGFTKPWVSLIDTVHHKYFVADSENNRVLVYSLTAGDLFPDRIADNVLGQPDLTSADAATTQSGMDRPTGLALDASGNRLFVADTNNDRVLIFDIATVTNGENATNVLGQADFTSGTPSLSQSRMNNPFAVAYDASGNRLFVGDSFNFRVLVYDVASITDGENAVNVLGQANFTSNTTSTTQSTLASALAVSYDGSSRLFVADGSNHRIMVFDVAAITNGENAVNVLGQANFTSAATALTQSGLNGPFGVVYASTGSRLFVGDTSNHRVMVFDVAAITNGENAVNVLGQANFTSGGGTTSQSGFNEPGSVGFDVTNNRLFVSDGINTNNRVMVFDVASITDGENATDLLGQYGVTLASPSPVYTKSGMNNGPNPHGFSNPYASAFDTVNHRYFLSDASNRRILVYNLNVDNTFPDRIPDNVLCQADLLSNVLDTTQSICRSPAGLVVDTANNRLFAVDTSSNRVLVFDVATVTNGENATGVLGQASFTTLTYNTTQSGMGSPIEVAYDSAGSRLFVTDSGNSRVLVFDVATVTNGENATGVLGQPDFTTLDYNTTQNRMAYPYGVAYDAANNRLFVSDGDSSRVTTYDVATVTNGENAVNVLGEANFTSISYATTQSDLNYPFGIAYDAANTRLFVADNSGRRVVVFDVASITNGENATYVLGQPNFTSSAAATTQAGMQGPQSVTYDATNSRLFVADYSLHRVQVFDVAVAAGSNSPTLSNKVTLSRVKVSTSATAAVTFTLQNTLSGTLTVTFPGSFTVTAAGNGGASSACLSSFGFTSTTLTATKTNCSGTVTLGGATVTNPSSPGTYHVSWVNDDPGGADVVIVSEDQVGVTSSVDPTLTFNAGAQAAATACDGAFSGNGGTVALGTVTTGAVASSDASSVAHLCTRVSTNGSAGAVVTVKSANAGLKSTSVPADVIASATATLAAGTAGYGLCAGSAGGDSGRDSTTPTGSAPARSSPFNGASCASSGHDVGALTTAAQSVWSVASASQNAFFRLYVKAAVGATTPAHNDYADTLTLVATGTY